MHGRRPRARQAKDSRATVQYGVYSEDDVLEVGGSEGGFVSWHLDKTPSGPRRITVVVLLQKCQEGGEFKFETGIGRSNGTSKLEPGDADRVSGMNTQHQVSPVMKGVRKSLVRFASAAAPDGASIRRRERSDERVAR